MRRGGCGCRLPELEGFRVFHVCSHAAAAPHLRRLPGCWCILTTHHVHPCTTATAVVAAGGGDAVDVAVVESGVLAEIKGSRSGAEHFRIVSVMGNGEFGYVFKVRCDVS